MLCYSVNRGFVQKRAVVGITNLLVLFCFESAFRDCSLNKFCTQRTLLFISEKYQMKTTNLFFLHFEMF